MFLIISVLILFLVFGRIAICYYQAKQKVEAVIRLMMQFYAKVAMQNEFKC